MQGGFLVTNMKLVVTMLATATLVTLIVIVLSFGVTLTSMYFNNDSRLVQAHSVPEALRVAADRMKEVQEQWDNEYFCNSTLKQLNK